MKRSFQQAYRGAMRDYILGSGGEAALLQALDLGRQALKGGLGILDVTAVHTLAMLQSAPELSLDPERLAELGEDFLCQCLVPYEVLSRGYADSNRLLLGRLADQTQTQDELEQRMQSQMERLEQAEAALLQEQERTRYIVRSAPILMASATPEGQATFANPAYTRVTGYTLEDLKGRSLWEVLYPGPLAAQLEPMFQTLHQAGNLTDYEMSLQARGGERKVVSWSTLNRLDSQGRILEMVGIGVDVTERRQAERREAMQRSITSILAESASLEEAAPALLQAVTQGMECELADLWMAEGGQLRHLHASCASPEPGWLELKAYLAQREFVYGRGLAGGVWASGCPAWIDDLRSTDMGLDRAVLGRAGARAAFRCPVSAAGQVLGVLGCFSSEIQQGQRLQASMEAVAHQVGLFVERRRSEEALRRSQEQLHQSQKLESIGLLAGGVAHDFNNLLTVIMGYTEMLLAEGLSEIQPELEEILNAGTRAALLTRQLLTFSRKQVVQPRVVDVNQVVREMHQMLVRLIGEDIQLVSRLQASAARVKADPGQLGQVILNLVVNARDAIQSGGRIEVETDELVLDPETVAGLASGRYLRLQVSDTGHGMDSDTLARIFDPFFTTKALGQGTGLGLSTVYGIVKQSGGHISVYSEVGRGTTFKVFLPRVDEPNDLEPADSRERPLLRGSERVLVVEDDEVVRGLLTRVLRVHGYAVLEARHGQEALELLEQQPVRVDLVVSDVVMPQMGGLELAQSMRKANSNLRVLFLSGYSESMVRQGFEQGHHFLQKPFNQQSILRSVRAALEGDGPAG